MGDLVVDNLKNRQTQFGNTIKELAYERLKLIRKVEEIDKQIGQLEGAQVANDLTQKDIDLRETIAQAKREKQEAESG